MSKARFASLLVLALVLLVGAWALVGKAEIPSCECDFPGEGIYGVISEVQSEQTCVVKPNVLVLPNGELKTYNK